MISLQRRWSAATVVIGLLLVLGGPASAGKGGFTRGATFDIDGEAYYLDGPVVSPDGARDIPGHSWVQSGQRSIRGKHDNSADFWSSDAGDGELLYVVIGQIDTWSEEKAARYAAKGYMHYHEFVSVEDGTPHPELVVWLKHHAVTHFTLDGGPKPELTHEVAPGVDYEFIPNWSVPYDPGE